MHNLQLSEDQELVVDTVRKFVADAIAPVVIDKDQQRTFLRAEFDGLAELGLCGLPVAEDNGGAGLGLVPLVAALECIGAESASLARLFLGQVQCALVLEAASATALEGVVMGSTLAVYVGREHGLALVDGRLVGHAELVPGGGEAALFVVAATGNGEPVLVTVDAGAAGRTALASLGLASSAPASVAFAGAAAEELLRGEAALAAIARAELAAHIGVAATAVGGGTGACAVAHGHAAERVAFGKPLLGQQAVQHKLVESALRLAAARQLTWQAARLHELGRDARTAAMQARLCAVDAMLAAADEAIQIMGGFGYTVEYHAERHYRDAKTLEVLDGGALGLRDALAAGLAK